jgi:hypothetical protein
MTLKRTLISCASLLLISVGVQAQGDTKHFAKDGLSFDYANGWTVTDQSNSDAQQLTLTRADSDAQIRIFAHRGRVDSPEKMAQAKKAFIDPYVSSTNNQFVQMGGRPQISEASTQIGGGQAEGVRLRASLSGEPGEAAIYWIALGNRVVVMTFFGPDQALKRATPAWDTIRNSVKVELPPPPGKQPTPKPSPTKVKV